MQLREKIRQPRSRNAPRARGEDRRCMLRQQEHDSPTPCRPNRKLTYKKCTRLEFCSRDPIGYEGSEWNLYEYALGSPTVFIDFLRERPSRSRGGSPATPIRTKGRPYGSRGPQSKPSNENGPIRCGWVMIKCRTKTVAFPVTANSVQGYPSTIWPTIINARRVKGNGCVTYPWGIHCTHSSCADVKKHQSNNRPILDHEGCHVCSLIDFPIARCFTYPSTIRPWSPDPCHGNEFPSFPLF